MYKFFGMYIFMNFWRSLCVLIHCALILGKCFSSCYVKVCILGERKTEKKRQCSETHKSDGETGNNVTEKSEKCLRC